MAGKKKKKIVRPAAYTPKKAEYKPMSKKTKLGILIGVCVLAVAIVLFALLYDDGSLKVSGGAIKGAQENWLITDTSSSSSRHKYYKFGEIEPLEGFSRSTDGSLKAEDDLDTDFPMTPDDESAAISSYYVTGIARNAEDIINDVYSYYCQLLGECGEIQTLTREDGKVVRFFLSNYYKAEDSTDGTDSQSATAYLEAGKNRCVLISVTNNLTEGRERLSDEEMIDWVRRIAETITIEEPESK